MQNFSAILSTTRVALLTSFLLFLTVAGYAAQDDPPVPLPPAPPAPVEVLPTPPVPPAPLVPEQVYGPFDPTRPCTGVLVDARHLRDVKRCQSPVLLMKTEMPDCKELYPDPTCLPNLQELQEEGIVRFYHSVPEARKGFIGDNPFIIRAIEFAGPYSGNLVISKEDGDLLLALEKQIHFTQNWHVGFLLPSGK